MNETAKIFQTVLWFLLCAAVFTLILTFSLVYRVYVSIKEGIKIEPQAQIAKSIS